MASWSRVCCQPATWFGQSPWRCFGSGRGVEVCTRQLLAVLSEGSVAPPAFTLTGRPAPVRTVVGSEEARQKQETVLGWEGPGRGRDYRETEGSPGPLQVRGRGAPAEAPGKAQSGTNGNLLFPELFLEDCGPSTPVMLWGPTNTAAQLSCWENLRPACGADLGDRFPQCQGPPLRLHPQLVRVSVGDVGGCGTRRDRCLMGVNPESRGSAEEGEDLQIRRLPRSLPSPPASHVSPPSPSSPSPHSISCRREKETVRGGRRPRHTCVPSARW